MRNQKQYDEAVALLDKLEGILGTTLSCYYDEDPRDELWHKFATEEEKAERLEQKRKQKRKRWKAAQFRDISGRTAAWAESQLLEHAEPLLVLEKFAGARPMPAASETIKFRRGEGEADSP